MVVLQVLFKNEGNEEVITLEEISIREDYLEVKDHIYCPIEGCQCRMVYVPRGVKRAYFKKLKGDNHNEDACPHYVATGIDGRPRRTSGINASLLKSEHKKSMLRGIFKTYLETEEERLERMERERERARKRRNQRVNKNNNPVEEIVNNPTTSNDGERLEDGQRNPPVKRRHSILDVVENDIGSTIVVIGTITSIVNRENQSILTITDRQHRQEFRLYLEQVFYESSPLNTPQMLITLKSMVESLPNIVLSVVGEILVRNEELGMLVLAEEDLRFNGMTLGAFLMNDNIA